MPRPVRSRLRGQRGARNDRRGWPMDMYRHEFGLATWCALLVCLLATPCGLSAQDRSIDSRGDVMRGVDRLRTDAPSYRKQWALVIGINYDSGPGSRPKALGRLASAENDARAVGRMLRDTYGFDVRERIGTEATREAIERAIDETLCDRHEVTDRDSALFFFAGHAWREPTADGDEQHVGFLCPSDVAPDPRDATEIARTSCVTMHYVLQRLDELCHARHRLLILDCCHAGEVFNVPHRGGARSDRGFRADLFRNRSFYAIAAARDSENARDEVAGSNGHSPFTACLLDSLREGPALDGSEGLRLFTASQLFRDVSLRFDRLRTNANSAAMAQDPQGFAIRGGGQLYFFRGELTAADLSLDEQRAWATARRVERVLTAPFVIRWAWLLVPVTVGAGALVVHRIHVRRGHRWPEAGAGESIADSEPARHVRFSRRAMLALLSIHLGSLIASYYTPWTTEAWTVRFDQLGDPDRWPRGAGFAIEAVRGIIAIWLVAIVCCRKFRFEFFQFVSFRHHSVRVNAARVAYLVIAVYFAAHESYRQLDADRAPRKLSEWAADYGIASTPEGEWYPYAAYLPYSLVCYTVLLPMLIVVPLYAFSRDVREIAGEQAALEGVSAVEGASETDIVRKLDAFAFYCHRTCARYVDVLALLAWAVHFEYWLGSLTLTKEGFGLMAFAWLLVAGTAAVIAWIAYAYGAQLEMVERALVRTGCLQVRGVLDPRGAFPFLKRILIGRVSGLVVVSLVFPFIHFVIVRSLG